MEPLAFIAKHFLNKPGRDLLGGYIADRAEQNRVGSSDREHFNKLTVRLQRLKLHYRGLVFYVIDETGTLGTYHGVSPAQSPHAAANAMRSLMTAVNSVALAASAPNPEISYNKCLDAMNAKIPHNERWRFQSGGDIYGIFVSIFQGKRLRGPSPDTRSIRGMFILNTDMSLVKEVIVYGAPCEASYAHEIVKFSLNRSGHYKLHVGLHARLFWLNSLRFL